MEKRTLRAREILEDLRSGLSRDDLMEKYEISADALAKVLTKMINAGILTEDEIRRGAWLPNQGAPGDAGRGSLNQATSNDEQIGAQAGKTHETRGTQRAPTEPSFDELLKNMARKYGVSFEDAESLRAAASWEQKIMGIHRTSVEQGKAVLKDASEKAEHVFSQAEEVVDQGMKRLLDRVGDEATSEEVKGIIGSAVPYSIPLATGLLVALFAGILLTDTWLWFLACLFVGGVPLAFLLKVTVDRTAMRSSHVCAVGLLFLILSLGWACFPGISFNQVSAEVDQMRRAVVDQASSATSEEEKMKIGLKVGFAQMERWDKKFKGKEVKWSGIVKGFSKTDVSTMLILVGGDDPSRPANGRTDCWLLLTDRQLREKGRKFEKGDKVKFKGKLDDFGPNDIIRVRAIDVY